MGIGVSTVITMAVTFLLVAVLAPIAIGTIINATTTNWDPAVKTIFQVLLPLLWIIGVAIRYIPQRS